MGIHVTDTERRCYLAPLNVDAPERCAEVLDAWSGRVHM